MIINDLTNKWSQLSENLKNLFRFRGTEQKKVSRNKKMNKIQSRKRQKSKKKTKQKIEKEKK